MDPRLIGQLRKKFPLLLPFPYGATELFRGLKSLRSGRYVIIQELLGLLDDHRRRSGESVKLTMVFEEDGVLRHAAQIAGMYPLEIKLLELLTESWSEETCEICGGLGFIDVLREPRRCRCSVHQECDAKRLDRDEQAFATAAIDCPRIGMPVRLFYHIAEIKPAKKANLLHLTVYSLPNKIRSLSEQTLLGQCQPMHYPNLRQNELNFVFDELRDGGIAPVILNGMRFIT